MKKKIKSEFRMITLIILSFILSVSACKEDPTNPIEEEEEEVEDGPFYFGADLSYVNQILDHNGVYKDQGVVKDPYKIFHDRGTDIVRLRLWHDPQWTKTVYNPEGDQMYNDLYDVEKAIAGSKAQGMEVLLDFHYSDVWADPGKQEIPAAWANIIDINVLEDSIYNYTFQTLNYLNNKGLMPEFVQIGNETNCGMMYHGAASSEFPAPNGCDGNWGYLRGVINSAIQAVRDVEALSDVDTKIILHIADPVNVAWWFDNLKAGGVVTDFDIIGFSYYPLWHDEIPISELSQQVATFKEKYEKDIMILEIAYAWTTAANDQYGNIFGSQTPVSGYPFTKEGQLNLMKDVTQALIDGGGIGIFYWEPAWITSDMKDLWGTGSAWENCALFDYEGNAHQGFDFMTFEYEK